MASSHGNNHTEAAKMEQIITEFFAKSLHIILESRSPFVSSRNFSGEQTLSSPSSSSSSSSSVRPRDKWFNLALRESPAALENFDLWHQSNMELVVVDVVLIQKPLDWDPVNFSPKREEVGCDAKSEKIIERWVVQYESRKSRDCGSGSRRTSNTLHTCYKKLILLLRSLYVAVRLLPAYKIFQDLNSSGQIRAFTLAYRVSSFVEPFTRKEESDMQQFTFVPVDTLCGRLCLSVIYRSSVSDLSSESSTPMSPQFIPDYVGSPLADPLKRFPSLPVSHGSPSTLPFSRRHSWSFDHYKVSPPSISFSPSPTHSEPHASVSNSISRCFPAMNLPPHPMEVSSVHKKNTSFDEYFPSPNFTPSPSASPPIYIPNSDLSKIILRSESAPIGIPATKLSNNPVLSNRQTLPPSSPPVKGPKSGTRTGVTIEKFYSIGKDDTRKYSCLKISTNSSPRILVSRSCSRSFRDDFDDTEFPCPFDVDDDDITNPGSRLESFDRKGHLRKPLEPGGPYLVKSQDAAIGDLVDLLQKALPLQQDLSSSWSSNQPDQNRNLEPLAVQQASVSSIGPVKSKTTADALEELQGYREMVKNLLLGQAGEFHASADSTPTWKPNSGT